MSLADRTRREIVDAYRTLEEVNAVQALEIKTLRERLQQCEARNRNWDSLYTVACAERDKANALLLECIGISNARRERLAQCEAALEAICNFGFCPSCGCNLANTEDCRWCALITAARAALEE